MISSANQDVDYKQAAASVWNAMRTLRSASFRPPAAQKILTELELAYVELIRQAEWQESGPPLSQAERPPRANS